MYIKNENIFLISAKFHSSSRLFLNLVNFFEIELPRAKNNKRIAWLDYGNFKFE